MSVLIDSRLIGQTIRALRQKSRLTQSDLADAIGYSVRNIRRIETDGTMNRLPCSWPDEPSQAEVCVTGSCSGSNRTQCNS